MLWITKTVLSSVTVLNMTCIYSAALIAICYVIQLPLLALSAPALTRSGPPLKVKA